MLPTEPPDSPWSRTGCSHPIGFGAAGPGRPMPPPPMPPPPLRAPAPRHRLDIVASAVLSVLQLAAFLQLAAVALLTGALTLLFHLGERIVLFFCSDNCPAPTDYSPTEKALLLVIVVAVVSVLTTVGGSVAALRRGRPIWPWPALGMALLVGGYLLADRLP